MAERALGFGFLFVKFRLVLVLQLFYFTLLSLFRLLPLLELCLEICNLISQRVFNDVLALLLEFLDDIALDLLVKLLLEPGHV